MTVSYTHLDVYKRQVFEKAFRTKAEEVIPLSPQLAVAKEKEYKKNSPNPVSYTHLDVYKRQVWKILIRIL